MTTTGDVVRVQTEARRLARRLLEIAVDASPHAARSGETVVSLLAARPAAYALLGDPADAAGTHPSLPATADRVTDGRGFHRPVYRYLLADLRARAGVPVDARMLPTADGEVHLRWYAAAVGRAEAGMLLGENLGATDDPAPAALHAQGVDDTPDAWVFRELVGLHALGRLAVGHGDAAVRRSARSKARAAARYHLTHTQPDYTTYQPWALAVFAAFPETVPFAEQQLHDVETHLHLEGPAGALVPGLLLADAVDTLAGRPRRPYHASASSHIS